VVKGNRWIYDRNSKSKTLRDRHNHTVATVWDDGRCRIGADLTHHKSAAAAEAYAVEMMESQGVQLSALTRTVVAGNVKQGAA
jgi:hypothetical protein